MRTFRRVAVAVVVLALAASAVAQVSLTTLGSPYTQNFDTLATSGTTNAWSNNSTIAGWYAQFQSGTLATYRAGTGTDTTGALYSFGAALTAERALGSVSSGTPVTIFYAVRLVNNTGYTLTALDIAYNGEQWRNGGNTTAQKLDFQYQVAAAGTITNANAPSTGWSDANALDFTGPIATATAGALDGNAAANRTALSSTLNVAVPNGQEIWLRWMDVNDAGNDHGLGVDDLSITPKAAPNVVSITRAGADPTNAASVAFTVTFDQSVTGVDAADFALTVSGVTGASVGTPAGGGTTWTVPVNTGAGSGTIGLDVVNDGSIVNANGTSLAGTATGPSYTIDKTAPAISSIVRASANPTNAASVDFTVTFDESASGVTTSSFALTATVTGAAVTGVAGSGTTYTVSVNSGSGSGSLRLDGAADSAVVDALGNANASSFAGGESYTVDKSGPTVSSIVRASADPTGAASVDFTVTFDESVSGVDAADFALTTTGLTGAAVTGVAGSGTTYTVTASTGTGASGTLRLDLGAGASIADALGNPYAAGAFTSGQSYTIDRSTPSVSSVVRADPSPSGQASVHFTVTFSQSVTGVDATDFALTTTGVSGASVSGVAGSGAAYTVTVNSGSGDGTIRLDVANDGSIQSGTSVPLGGGFTAGEVYTIDKTAPAVSSVMRANADPTNAAAVDFTVTFSESVIGVAAADFTAVGSGVTGASVTGVSGSGTTYTVTVNSGGGDGTLRLDVVTGGTIIDLAGNLLASGFTGGESYSVDKTAPSVSSIVRAGADPSSAAAVDFTVTFSESVAGVAAGDFTVTAPSLTGTSISTVTGSGALYTVTVNSGSGNGTLRLDFTGSASDPAGNAAASFTGGESYTMQGTPPAPAGLSATAGNAHVALTWSAATGATTYNVKRGTVTGGPYTTLTSSEATTGYDDTSAANGTPYFYVVSANGTRGTSGDSSEVTATPTAPAASSAGVVISQVYGGGGNSGSTYKNDFIELFNKGNATVNLSGWSVQYVSAAGTGTWSTTALSGSIAPGHYFLIQESQGTGGTTVLPTPDVNTGTILMSATAGKVALVNVTTPLTGGCPTGTQIADLVGYGSTATCFEGTGPTPAPSNSNAVFRADGGCTDTNNNAADFAAAAAAPRNTASPAHDCSGFAAAGAATPSSVDPGSATLLTATVTPGASPASTGIAVAINLTSIGGSATQAMFDDGSNGDVTAGDNVFSFNATVALGTTSGVKNLTVTATDAQARTTGTNIALTVMPSLSTIAAAKVDGNADSVPDLLGQLVKIRGVVTSIDFRGGTGIEYYVQDATGGIDVFNSTTDFGPFTLGTNVELVGTVAQFNGLTEVTPSSVTTLAGGTLPAVTPQVVTLAQLADGSGESLEGKLVQVNNVTITAGSFPAAGTSGNVTISDGSTTGTLRVDSDTDVDGTTTPAGTFSVIGLVSQSDTTSPFDCCYQILPRSLADLFVQTPPTGSGSASPSSVAPGAASLLTVAVTAGQNPTSTGVTVTADLTGIGGSASQSFYDDATHGDVTAGDGTFSLNATVAVATALGAKSLPVTIADAQARASSASIALYVQSATAPPPPTGLTATPGNAQVALAWSASAGATGYNVKRATVSGGPYTTIASPASNSYTDTTVTNAIRYYYVVSATNPDESGPSNEANALPAAPPPSGSLAKVYYVDIGQGASTLIVSPTGKTLLVDGGPTGQGTAKIVPLLSTLGIATIDFTVLTHYHIDHDDGLIEVINAGKVAGTAYDNGDDPSVIPPNFSTSPTSTYGTYARYVSALSGHSGTITRAVGTPGTVIDLGGGLKATILAQAGKLLSGGTVAISNQDLNTESISLLVEYGNFDFLVSGDLTGGGSTDTAKTPDVETFVAQMSGDVDVMEFDHHGSTTANNRRFLRLLKAEAALAEAGYTNTFGHPNRETVNKYLNIPATSGNTYGGTGLATPGNGPVAYQTDPSPASDQRCTVQGYSGAAPADAGNGTILLKTDGTTSFTMESFEDGGVRISPAAHVYALDATGSGITTNFPPTVIPSINPAVPLATDAVTVTAKVDDREDAITSVTLNYAVAGLAQAPITMTPAGGDAYTATIAAQPDGTRVDYTVTAVAGGASTSYSGGYFAGTTPISSLRAMDALGSPVYWDYAARVQGVVTAGTGNFASGTNDDYLEDATGAINVWRTLQPSTPAVQTTTAGSIYSVAGLIGENGGRLRLEVTPRFTDTSSTPYGCTLVSASSVPSPLVKTIAQINAAPESLEAHLVQINNCTITSGTFPPSGAALDAFVTISDGSGSMQLKIDHNTDIPGMTTPSGSFTVAGIVQQDDFLRPFDAGYDVAPRNRVDVGGTSSVGPGLITIAEARVDVDAGGFTPGDYVPDRLNSTVHVQGVVTSINFRASNGSGIEYYVQDATAGVDVFSTATTRSFAIGDNVDVVGTVKQFNGLTEIDPGATLANLTLLTPGTLPAVAPQLATCAQLGNAGAGEPLEGRLLRLNNVTLTAPPATFAASTNYAISDATGPCTIRISASTNLVGQAPPAGTFSVVGVLGQFDSSAPFDSGYQLFPRSTSDMLPPVVPPASIAVNAGSPQSATVGTPFATPLAAIVKDSGNAPISGADVTFTAPASGASGTFAGGLASVSVATDGSGIATAPAFTANATAGTYNVVASTASLTANFSLTNLAPAATHFSVTAPASVGAYEPFNVTVTALDGSNATVAGYRGTVHFTSGDSGAFLPADTTFTAGDNGVHTVSVTLRTVGMQTIVATDTVTPSITGSASVLVGCPEGPAPYVVASNNGPSCGTPVTLFVTGLGASPTFAWTGPNGFTSSLQSPTTTVAGTYFVTVTGVGCDGSASASTIVVINTAPPAAITAPAKVCAGTANNTATVPLTAGATYAWSITNGVLERGATSNSVSFKSGDGGNVILAVTVTSSAGCTASATKTIATIPRPTATLPPALVRCGPGTVSIPVALTGTAPFTLVWSDGVTQSGIATTTVTRSVTLTSSTTLGIVSMTDASCNGTVSNAVTITVEKPASIEKQPKDDHVKVGDAAHFEVEAGGTHLHYAWFRGTSGDTSTPVGGDSASFTTGPLTTVQTFWVRVSNDCSSVDSVTVTATPVPPRRRAAGV